MSIGRYLKSRLGVYRREFTILILSAATLFLSIALWSYNQYDPSWFYYTTNPQPILNWCGVIGSQVAALVWYLCGSARWLLLANCMFTIWLLMYHDCVRACWERIAAAVLAMVVAASICTFYTWNGVTASVRGGALGWSVVSALYPLIGYAGLHIFLATSMIGCLIIMTRLSWSRMRQLANVAYACVRVAWTSMRLVCRMVQCAVVDLVVAVRRGSAALYIRTSDVISRSRLFARLPGVIPSHDDFTVAEKQEDFVSTDDGASLAPEPVAMTPHDSSNSMPQNEAEMQATPEGQSHAHEYVLPSLTLFIAHEQERTSASVKQELESRARVLEEKLRHFGISGCVVEIKRGPVVSVFEYLPAIDTKLSKILSLEDDLAMALQAMSIRILAPIPGKPVVGFEVANKKRHDVLFSAVVKSHGFTSNASALPLVLGKDTIGTDVVVDLARMPHLLIAGSTGSGKSVALNTMLISLLCRRTPDEMRLILIDPKRLEFASYADIAHLLFPIVTDPKGAAPVLRWVVGEMERRYEQMAVCGVRNMYDYNRCTKHASHADPLPYIVVIIDELADLMMTASKDVEDLITRITQMARAAGIHMIVATQRPSVDVITGLIKVNFPSRISFRVTSKIDSRTILDCAGADKLLGNGDMLFLDAATSSLRRVHGAYITSAEIDAVVNHIRAERQVQYLQFEYEAHDDQQLSHADDQLFAQVVDFLQETEEVSISQLQRRFKIGYNRSARIIEFLETKGMILPADGSKTRKVVR